MEKLDILNREEFVKKLLCMIENIADNKSATCFALNGEWGCGKSFVLDMLEEQLSEIQSEETSTDKYFVIRYNCWKYDYYEEPLIAIVSNLIAVIEEKTALFPSDETKREVVNTLKAIVNTMFYIGSTMLKNKTGIDVQKTREVNSDSKKSAEEKYEKEHKYDVHFVFNKVLDNLSGILQEIAQEYTIVIIVDELDRCLPEYAIKVLERLHHLTEGRSNIITTVAIDKKQLMSSVKHAFGFENPEKYLEKFVHFEIKLDIGIASDKIMKKYAPYFDMFDKSLLMFDESVEDCIRNIFKGIDIRTQEQIIKKTMLIHKLLFTEKKDYSFMCMELILAIMAFAYNKSIGVCGRIIEGMKTIGLNSIDGKIAGMGITGDSSIIEFLNEKIKALSYSNDLSASSIQGIYTLKNRVSLYGAILYACHLLCVDTSNNAVSIRQNNLYDGVLKNREDLKKYFEMLQMMR